MRLRTLSICPAALCFATVTPLVVSLWADGPTTRFSTFLGGTWNDSGNAIAVDSSGYIYVGGDTESRDFPVTPGALRTIPRPPEKDPRHRPAYIGFVAKLDRAGKLVWSTYLGGSSVETVKDVAVDGGGSVYITGSTESRDFPVTRGVVQPSYGGGGQPGDAYVVKLSAADGKIVYATYLGGTGPDAGASIAVDTAGNVYVTGNTMSADFPTTQHTIPRGGRVPGGSVFACKLSADGKRLLYSTIVGADRTDRATGIAVDSKDRVYITGVTNSAAFPTTARRYRGAGDVFVIRLSSSLANLEYSLLLGGRDEETSGGIAVDEFGAAYVAGTTRSSDFPTTKAVVQPRYGGGASDGFIAKIGPTGKALDYSTYLGGNGFEDLYGIALDSQRNALITGRKSAMGHYPETSGGTPSQRTRGECMVLSRISVSGTRLLYSRQYCADNPTPMFSVTIGHSIAIHGPDAYVTGWTACPNFPATAGIAQPRYRGGHEPFVLGIRLR